MKMLNANILVKKTPNKSVNFFWPTYFYSVKDWYQVFAQT